MASYAQRARASLAIDDNEEEGDDDAEDEDDAEEDEEEEDSDNFDDDLTLDDIIGDVSALNKGALGWGQGLGLG